jgi:hypothetical protein
VHDKVFIYLRLITEDGVLTRSKIREFAGLGTLLADFLRSSLGQGLGVQTGQDGEVTALPTLEYVDSNTDETLISFRVDLKAGEQVVTGCIPPAYHDRMLDPNASSVSTSLFLERAAPDLPDEERDDLALRLSNSRMNLLDRIREGMDAEGRFEIHMPIS